MNDTSTTSMSTSMQNLHLNEGEIDSVTSSKETEVNNDNNDDSYTNDDMSEFTEDKTSFGVNTEDCIPISQPVGTDVNRMKKKYSVNPSFNNIQEEEPVPVESPRDSKEGHVWLPTILRDESWPEENSAFISDVANGLADINNDPKIIDNVLENPLQSTIRETVIMKEDRSSRDNADWKKAQKEEEFNRMINNNNNRLKDLPTDLSSIPNTFANKKLGKEFVSPLKLFGFEDSRREESRLPVVMENSEKLYDKIVRNISSNGNLIKTQEREVSNNENVNEDITSDADEFSSFPSTTRKLFKEGDQLFQNIQNGYQNNNQLNIAQLKQMTHSDYTSADDESVGEVEVGKRKFTQPSIDTIRKQFESQAKAFQKEFNMSPPKLQSKFRSNSSLVEGVSRSVESQKFKGLKFIPAEDYKDKVFDKNLNTFVPKSEYIEQLTSNNSSYTDDFETNDYEEVNGGYNDNEEEDDNLLNNFSDEFTNNSVKKTVSKGSLKTLRSSEGLTDVAENGTDDESFTINDKLLVECINESYPVEEWDNVEKLDISEFGIEHLHHLDKMTPNLWFLNASNNKISQNFGIPRGVQYLDLSRNKFSNISAKFDAFKNLQVLNLSHNHITDLRCLKELKNLTSLNLSYNAVESIEFLNNFKMLHYLNLSNNKLKGVVDFSEFSLWFLEDLIIDNNEIEGLINICELSQLINISANNNRLSKFQYYKETPRFRLDELEPHLSLRRICVNGNSLGEILDLSMYVELKEAQFDNNEMLEQIYGISTQIEKISCRFNRDDQLINNVLKFGLSSNNLKILYLSGGKLPIKLPNFKSNFTSITNLDISAMNISELPAKFGEFFPLLIDLNLNFNRLKNLKGLETLSHLKLLKLLGNDIEDLESIVDYTSNIRMRLKLLDLRVNPLTRDMYPFVFYNDEETESGAGAGSTISPAADETTALAFQLQDPEDIDAFAVEYSRMYTNEGLQRWALKHRRHQKLLRRGNGNGNGNGQKYQLYLSALVTWFPRLSLLDGTALSRHDREAQGGLT